MRIGDITGPIHYGPDEGGSAPWADDLRAVLGEEHAGAFDPLDGYLREKWQPRVTALEEETKDARELWADLQDEEKGPTALYALIHSAYGDEFGEKYLGLFGEDEPAEETAAAETATEETAAAQAALSDEDRELLDWARTRREKEQAEERDSAYQEMKNGLPSKYDDITEKDLKLIDPFIAGAPDIETAVAAYKGWREEAHGVLQPGEGQPEEIPDPPPVLGTEGAAGAGTPPTASKFTKYNQMDDALDHYFETHGKSATPPPVLG